MVTCRSLCFLDTFDQPSTSTVSETTNVAEIQNNVTPSLTPAAGNSPVPPETKLPEFKAPGSVEATTAWFVPAAHKVGCLWSSLSHC